MLLHLGGLQTASSVNYFVAVSRKAAAEVPSQWVPAVVRHYLKQGTVRIADIRLKRFVEVSPVGVARAWSHDA